MHAEPLPFAVELVASLLLLTLTWPVMLATAFAIWWESGRRGPIFYKQARVGRNDRVFEVLKFRSMRTDAEQNGIAQWAQKNDSRVTRVGAFIRKTRIDELPQLFNVLRGEMSLAPGTRVPLFVRGDDAFIGSTGLNLLDLRNLGTERTLVLVDGRRHVEQREHQIHRGGQRHPRALGWFCCVQPPRLKMRRGCSSPCSRLASARATSRRIVRAASLWLIANTDVLAVHNGVAVLRRDVHVRSITRAADRSEPLA